MDLPTLENGEQWRLQTPDVLVRYSHFNLFLTDRRVILKSLYDPLMPDKDLTLDRIEGLESSANDAGEPVLTLIARTSCGESRRLILTFFQIPGSPFRQVEREEWIRHLSTVPVCRMDPISGNSPNELSQKNGEKRVRYDSGKLAFNPGICNSKIGEADLKRKDRFLKIHDNRKGNEPPRHNSPGEKISPRENGVFPHESSNTNTPRSSLATSSSSRTCRQPSSEDAPFFCMKCGSRVCPGSLFCDRCGEKVIPPDPVQSNSSSVPMFSPGINYRIKGMPGNPGSQVMEADIGPQAHEPSVRVYDVMPSIIHSRVPQEDDAGALPQRKEYPGKFSLSAIFGKRVHSGTNNDAPHPCQSMRQKPGSVSPALRIAFSIVTIAMIVIIAAGMLSLVFPDESARALGTIFSAVTSSGNGNPTSGIAIAGSSGQVTARAESGSLNKQNSVSSVTPVGIYLRIQYPGSWSGSYGMENALQVVKDTGEKIFPVGDVEESVTASIRKEDESGDELTVELYRNGEMIATGHTTEPKGLVAITGSI